MKLFWKIVLTVLSLGLIGISFAYIPILDACGVDVFELRGLLVPLTPLIIGVCAIPFALCIVSFFRKKNKEEK